MPKPRYKPGELVWAVDKKYKGVVRHYLPSSGEYAVTIYGELWWLKEKELKPRKES